MAKTLCSDHTCLRYTAFIVLVAFLYACIEIEIEGKHGWAEKLPTARLTNTKTSLTVYHVLFFAAMCSLMHFPYITGFTWSVRNECFTLAMLMAFFLMEDVYWFALNPAYGLSEIPNAWWHRDSLCCSIPKIYFVLAVLIFAFLACSGYGIVPATSRLAALSLGVLTIVAPVYRHYKRLPVS
jgi:hypothetical protein